MEGYINLNRKLQEWEWYTTPFMVQLWVHLLLQANFRDKRWRGTVIKRGQLVASLTNLSEETGISRQSVRTALKRLEETGEINTQTNTRFTIITICKYDDYQLPADDVQHTEQHTANTPLTHQQHTANTIRIKGKKDIKETISKEIAKKGEEEEIDLENFTGADAPLSARQEPPRPKAESVEWVRRMFNEVCVDYPKVVSLSETRKAKIHIRLEEMRKIAPERDVLSAVLAKMQGSKFLKGDNHRGWKATFDWLIENPTNWVKVYEGNYDDRTASRPAPGRGGPDNHRVNDIWD